MSHRWLCLILAALPGVVTAQDWNSAATRDLIARAIARRTTETDSAQYAFRARARGLVTFRAEVGPTAVARPLKADQLDVEVYWENGKGSKQVIRGWRDSTFFPSGVNYHRDHLGIVTDDFGQRIRVGEGDEVESVLHPLAGDAPAVYEYLAGDTVTLATDRGSLRLLAVQVRPRDPSSPAAVGTFYLEIERAILVRAEFTFTPPAYRDADLEDVSIRLERSLIEGRFWLPFRQEIVVRRKSAILDFPLRGVIHGRWEIGDYEILPRLPPAELAGPAIDGLRRPGGSVKWTGPVAAALDSADLAADQRSLDDVRREATRLLAGRLLDGLPRLRPGAARISDLVRVNRVQGLALGAGASWRTASGVELRGRLGVGTSDGRITGLARIGVPTRAGTAAVEASRDIRDVSDVPIVSGPIGSFAAQEGGRDYGDYSLVERLALSLEGFAGMRAELAREWAWSVKTVAEPARNSYRPNPPLGAAAYWVARLSVARVSRFGELARLAANVDAEAGAGSATYGRLWLQSTYARSVAGAELRIAGWLGAGTSNLPARRAFVIGGRGTVPGEPHRAWGSRSAVNVTASWIASIPGPAIPLGRFGRTSPAVGIGPLIALGSTFGDQDGLPWLSSPGPRVAVGLAVEFLNGALRVELAQSMHRRFSPGLVVDVARDWWPVL